MKVLFVCREIPFYKISPIMTRQGDALKELGVSIEYYAIRGKGFSAYFKHIFLLKRYLKNNTYDILHAHYGLCGLVSLLAKKKQKTVISFMGSELIEAKENAKKLNPLYIIIYFANKYCIKTADFIIVKSKQMAGLIKKNNIEIIPNGIDLNSFYPVNKQEARKKLALNESDEIIIFIADPPNRPEKNLMLAKEAVKLTGNKNLKLLCLHTLEQPILNCYYSAADALLLTSLHEGSPNVIKEAMACNCPIVSTDVGDVKNNISNVDGCFITSFDVSNVADKINKALLFAKQNGKTNAREHLISIGLTSNTAAEKINKIYKVLLN